MKVLMVNKFLYPNGGSETYIFKIGQYLQNQGHEVQYFGMEHKGRIVGNMAESYTSDMDFHTGKLQKLVYPFRILYSREARVKIRKVLQDFHPDVVHLNNFNFQLTPSIIYEIKKFNIPIVYTAHDSQLVCPNHLMQIPSDGERCTRCLGGKYSQCTRNRCIHNSRIKSMLASIEAYLYRLLGTYRKLDAVIAPSRFLQDKLATNPALKDKIIMLHNFVDQEDTVSWDKEEYVLYFGRYSEEKGIRTLLSVCEMLPEIPFVFAGNGPLEAEVNRIENVKNIGFQTGAALREVIGKAMFSIFPSECYENCPFTVMESQTYGTPVIGTGIGGTPELIRAGETGFLFRPGDAEELRNQIYDLWNNDLRCRELAQNCKKMRFDTIEEYCVKLLKIYQKSEE